MNKVKVKYGLRCVGLMAGCAAVIALRALVYVAMVLTISSIFILPFVEVIHWMFKDEYWNLLFTVTVGKLFLYPMMAVIVAVALTMVGLMIEEMGEWLQKWWRRTKRNYDMHRMQ